MIRRLSGELLLTSLILLGWLVDSPAEDRKPQSPRVQRAAEEYRRAIARARDDYLKELNRALQTAKADKNDGEIKLIEAEKRDVDQEVGPFSGPIAKTQQRLIGTRWSFVQENATQDMEFKKDNVVVTSRLGPASWAALDQQTIVIYLDKSLFVLSFDEELTVYKVKGKFTPESTQWIGGKRYP